MGDHGHPAGVVHQVDAAPDVDGVPRHVRRAAVGQEPVERLLAGPRRDRRRPARRRCAGDPPTGWTRRRPAPAPRSPAPRARPACPAPVAADPSDRRGPAPSPRPAPGPPDRRRTRAGARSAAAAEQDSSIPRHHLDARSARRPRPASSQPVEGVVIGQRDHVQPGLARRWRTSSAGVSVPSETEEWVCRSILMPHTYHAVQRRPSRPLSSARGSRPRDDPQPDRGLGQVGPACRRDRPQGLDRLRHRRVRLLPAPTRSRRSASDPVASRAHRRGQLGHRAPRAGRRAGRPGPWSPSGRRAAAR